MPVNIPVMPAFNFGAQPTRESAYEFFISNMEQFQNRFRDVKYPDIFWNKVIPAESVDTGINPGASMVSYPVADWKGQGAFRARYGKNIPTVSTTFAKNNVPIQAAAISAIMDTDEIRGVLFGMTLDLRTRFPEIMRMACERHVEGVYFYGDPVVGFLPFLDFPGVPEAVAAAGAGGYTDWARKTPDEILADLNTALSAIWVNSRQVHVPNTIYLPPGHLGYIASTPRSANSDTTILGYFLKNNLFTNQGLGEVTVAALPYLGTAGVSGAARMIACERKGDNFLMPFPLPFELLAPQYTDLNIKLFAEYKFGAVHLPYPQAFLYTDGI
ncbi:MAG: DUF2184 domain-containing protein [Planctomycetota bacterium]|jgi:hypothetical protein|nr:DUF2184 domain-containing protein [Planctomycetota bacterium]